jgi:hypothetical protein
VGTLLATLCVVTVAARDVLAPAPRSGGRQCSHAERGNEGIMLIEENERLL